MLQKYYDVLSDLETFKMELTSEEPVILKPYPIPFSLTNAVKEELGQMLELDVIEKTNSAYASPIILVKKKDGTYIFCTDYRKLNQIVVYDAEPIPNIDQLLNKFQVQISSQILISFARGIGRFQLMRVPGMQQRLLLQMGCIDGK